MSKCTGIDGGGSEQSLSLAQSPKLNVKYFNRIEHFFCGQENKLIYHPVIVTRGRKVDPQNPEGATAVINQYVNDTRVPLTTTDGIYAEVPRACLTATLRYIYRYLTRPFNDPAHRREE